MDNTLQLIHFFSYLEEELKGGSISSYKSAYEKFECLVNNDLFELGNTLNQHKKICELFLLDPYKSFFLKHENTLCGYKSYLLKSVPAINESQHLIDYDIDRLKELKKSFKKNGNPILRAVSLSYGNGAMSAMIGKLIEYKKFARVSSKGLSIFILMRLPLQRIIQGPPGTGKSYRINQDLDKLKAKSKRIVCHPESTNAQFIGSYRPQSIAEQITYAFSPGPFIKLLVRALKAYDSTHVEGGPLHVLVIEELNRANSAAMFAEAFQLLDRVGSGDKEGWSEHPTDLGDDVLDYFKRELGEEHEEYVRARDEGVRLPPNFAIWATMNTADQGVFPMDTAFKRRWSFEHLGVDEGFETWHQDRFNPQLPTAGVPWQTFRVALNHALEQLEVEEDRLIGPFFLNERELQDSEANVVGKVISYLRDDVLRYEPKGLFVGVNDKGESDPEGRAPSFAWLKRQHAQTGLLSLFKGELSASLEFATSWMKAREDELNTQEAQEPQEPTMQGVLSVMSDAQTPHNTSEEHPIPGGS